MTGGVVRKTGQTSRSWTDQCKGEGPNRDTSVVQTDETSKTLTTGRPERPEKKRGAYLH